jgi:hypothetical protein
MKDTEIQISKPKDQINVKIQSSKRFDIWALDLICHLNFAI